MAPGNRKDPQRSVASESQYTLLEFMRDFPDDETCLTWLWNTRCAVGDPSHAHCPRCEEIREFRRYDTKQQRQSWTCVACGLNVHPTAGTIFHKSSTGLHLWFYAMYLMTSTRCGISAKQLERELGVTYKTAWRMFTLIRNELMGPEPTQMAGKVEMDEMYVGGKPRASDKAKWDKAPSRQSAAVKWSRENKTTVFGMVERNTKEHVCGSKPKVTNYGKVAAYVVPQKLQSSVVGHIDTHIERAAVLYTDDARVYDTLAKSGWEHRKVNHSEGIYVSGDNHTQQIEGFWSLVKRGISGTHHSVSAKWLQGYLNEYVWRYNHRDDGRSMFGLLILRAALR